jgi:hypothetical protein
MKRKEIVEVINEILETTWTDYECKHGKTIDMLPEWGPHMKELVLKYRAAGWKVERKVEIVSTFPKSPRIYAVFINPQFAKAGRERFEAKYGS